MYINKETNQVVSEYQIRLDNPNTSFATPFVAPDKYAIVFQAPLPAFDPITQFVREIAPVLTDKGHYEQQYEIVALENEVILANQAAKVAAFITQVTDTVQARLDDFAKTRNYDGILSACTYAQSAVIKFKAEGQYCVDARDTTWAALYGIMADVQLGTRPMPTLDEILAELPVLTWPT